MAMRPQRIAERIITIPRSTTCDTQHSLSREPFEKESLHTFALRLSHVNISFGVDGYAVRMMELPSRTSLAAEVIQDTE